MPRCSGSSGGGAGAVTIGATSGVGEGSGLGVGSGPGPGSTFAVPAAGFDASSQLAMPALAAAIWVSLGFAAR